MAPVLGFFDASQLKTFDRFITKGELAWLPGELRLECRELEINISQVEEYLKEGYMVINFQPPFGAVVIAKTHCADCGYWAEREKPAFWPF